MIKSALRPCPICSCEEVQVLHRQTFVLPDGHPLSNGYDVVSCVKCGFVFAVVVVRQADYDRFYTHYSKYQDFGTSTGGGCDPNDQARLCGTAKCISEAYPNFDARIIDIGCANGGLLRELRRLGYSRLVGMDPSPVCVENTRKLSGADAYAASLSSLPDGLGKFDLVIMSHVLEHIQELDHAVFSVGQLLGVSGVVYAEVPDATRYADTVVAPFQDFNTEHINHFSRIALENLFAKIGLATIQSGSKTITVGQNSVYPAIYAFFRSGEPIGKIRSDPSLKARIQQYIIRSRAILKKIDARLQDIIHAEPDLIVWGTGQLLLKLLADTCLRNARIVAFVDGNPINQGKIINDSPVLGPTDIVNFGRYPILITTLLHQKSILDAIRSQGLNNPVYTLEASDGEY